MAGGDDGLLSFRQLRKTARAFGGAQCLRNDRLQLSRCLRQGLLADIDWLSKTEENRVEILLAVIEWQRLADAPLDLDDTFRALAKILVEGNAFLVRRSIAAHFDAASFLELVNWLIHQVGIMTSRLLASTPAQKQMRGHVDHRIVSAVEPPAILLHCLRQMSEQMHCDLPPSHFHVVALNEYLNARQWTGETARACCHFRGIISTPVKIRQLSEAFQERRQRRDREHMYSEIYSGSNYRRGRNGSGTHKKRLTVKRETVVEDSMALLDVDNDMLLNGIHISFVGEEGEDAGGLTKEWFLLLTERLATRVFRFGEEEATHMELSLECPLLQVELMGVMIGLSLLLQVVIDVAHLPRFLYRQLLTRPASCNLDDLKQIRPAVVHGLTSILAWEEDGFEERLSVNFTCINSRGMSVPLIAKGDMTPVTYTQRAWYVQRMCQFLVMEQSEAQLDALKRGFERVCHDMPSLQVFSVDELQGAIIGQEVSFTVESLRKRCPVDGQAYGDDDYLDQFWSIVGQDNETETLRLLLHFVTANHRVSCMTGKGSIAFQIVILQGQEFFNRLPTASTCTNTLFLPRYPTKALLQSRLLTALRLGSEGFGLK